MTTRFGLSGYGLWGRLHAPAIRDTPGVRYHVDRRLPWRLYTRLVEIVDAIRRVLEPRGDVRLAYLFGSAARRSGKAARDVDVGILFEPIPAPRALDHLASDLEAAGRRRVDLVVLNVAPPLLLHEVIRTGRLIVGRHEAERVEFEARAIARYLDTAYLRRVQRSYLRERVQAFRARSA
jgi:predicted nucleotidyltransferase